MYLEAVDYGVLSISRYLNAYCAKYVSQGVIMITSAFLLANCAVTNARLRIESGLIILRPELLYRDPSRDCE